MVRLQMLSTLIREEKKQLTQCWEYQDGRYIPWQKQKEQFLEEEQPSQTYIFFLIIIFETIIRMSTSQLSIVSII